MSSTVRAVVLGMVCGAAVAAALVMLWPKEQAKATPAATSAQDALALSAAEPVTLNAAMATPVAADGTVRARVLAARAEGGLLAAQDTAADGAPEPQEGNAPAMTRNPVRQDKPDDGQSFSTDQEGVQRNPVRRDKDDTGDFFTATQSGQTFNPCLKADGTTYRGPGTALDPFAPVNPCLPQQTAENFAPPLPEDTDSDVDVTPRGAPSITPAFLPDAPTGSDYAI